MEATKIEWDVRIWSGRAGSRKCHVNVTKADYRHTRSWAQGPRQRAHLPLKSVMDGHEGDTGVAADGSQPHKLFNKR